MQALPWLLCGRERSSTQKRKQEMETIGKEGREEKRTGRMHAWRKYMTTYIADIEQRRL